MKDGFVKVAAATPKIKVADVDYNGEKIKKYMKEASREGAVITRSFALPHAPAGICFCSAHCLTLPVTSLMK